MILGKVMAAAAGQPLGDLIQSLFVEPLGLTATAHSLLAEIPDPILHGYSAERRPFLQIPGTIRFIEESTTWSPSWTLAEGAIQTMDIKDMTTTMDAIGSGALLSEASYQEQMSPALMGFGTPLPGCANCRTMNESYNYGLGMVFNGDWMLQNPLFFGYGGLGAYLPSQRMAVSVMTNFAISHLLAHILQLCYLRVCMSTRVFVRCARLLLRRAKRARISPEWAAIFHI